MKQTKQTNCILLSDIENPLISQIIVLLNKDVISPQDEAVEISRNMVSNCMKNFRCRKRFSLKKPIFGIFYLCLGIIIGFFI